MIESIHENQLINLSLAPWLTVCPVPYFLNSLSVSNSVTPGWGYCS